MEEGAENTLLGLVTWSSVRTAARDVLVRWCGRKVGWSEFESEGEENAW